MDVKKIDWQGIARTAFIILSTWIAARYGVQLPPLPPQAQQTPAVLVVQPGVNVSTATTK